MKYLESIHLLGNHPITLLFEFPRRIENIFEVTVVKNKTFGGRVARFILGRFAGKLHQAKIGMLDHIGFYNQNNGSHHTINLASIGNRILFAAEFIVQNTKSNRGMQEIILFTGKPHLIFQTRISGKQINASGADGGRNYGKGFDQFVSISV